MAIQHNHTTNCDSFICCGAAYVSLDHQPGDPTSIDNAVRMVKGLFRRSRSTAEVAPSNLDAAPASSMAPSYSA